MPWQSSLQEGVITFTCTDESCIFNTFSIDIPNRKITIGPILPTLIAAEELLKELNQTQSNPNWLNDNENISDQRIVIRNFTVKDIECLETIAQQRGVFLRVYNTVIARTAPAFIPLTLSSKLYKQNAMSYFMAIDESMFSIENAMLRLNENEQETLSRVREHYAVAYNSLGGTEEIINGLKQQLIDYLKLNPLINPRDGRSALPLEWDELVKLNLDKDKEVLKVYYKSPHHTALRYFMQPNSWISPEALFVTRDEHGNAWSSLSKDPKVLEMIALFWLAASDPSEESVGPIDTRFRQNLFFEAIAGLTRGYNLNELHNKDDEKGDQPSCSNDVKQRLFNAVIEHSLFVDANRTPESHNFK